MITKNIQNYPACKELLFCVFSDGEAELEPVRRRETNKKRDFRHAYSEVLPDEDPNRRSQVMIDVKAHAVKRLRDELQIAQTVCIIHSEKQNF